MNNDTDRIVLSFDPVRQGIIISKTTRSSGVNLNYWYSLKTQAYYPETYPEECAIYCNGYYDSISASTRALLLGGADGYIRHFKDSAKDDDIGGSDKAISSYFTLTAFPVGDGEDSEGKIKQIVIESAGGASGGDFGDTDAFSYDIHVADTAETVIEDVIDGATPALSGTVTGPGRKSRLRSKIRGQYGTIRLYNSTAAQTWAINKIMIDRSIVGRLKDI